MRTIDGKIIVAVMAIGGLVAIFILASSGSGNDGVTPEYPTTLKALITRVVGLEREVAALRSTVEELENLLMLGSAQLDRRMAKIESGTRPIIQIEKATVWNTDGEIVVEENQSWSKRQSSK